MISEVGANRNKRGSPLASENVIAAGPKDIIRRDYQCGRVQEGPHHAASSSQSEEIGWPADALPTRRKDFGIDWTILIGRISVIIEDDRDFAANCPRVLNDAIKAKIARIV